MEHKGKRPVQPVCRCLELPPKTVLRDWEYEQYKKHLIFFSGGGSYDASGYYLCPQTGVVWVSKYASGFDWRIDDIVLEHTGLVLPEFPHRTAACVEAKLYQEPSPPDPQVDLKLPRGATPPEFPRLPLVGLIHGGIVPADRFSWAWESIVVPHAQLLDLWLYLFTPLNRGSSVLGWLASPFEPVSSQVLQTSLHLKWFYATREIGEVVVKQQMQIEASLFHKRFSWGNPDRDLYEEFEEWLLLKRRGRIGRFE